MAGVGADLWVDATPIGLNDVSEPTPNEALTLEPGEPTALSLYRSAWWRFAATADGWVQAHTGKSIPISDPEWGPDTTMTVWTGASLGALTEVVSADSGGDSTTFATSLVNWQGTAGTTYYIQVGMYAEDELAEYVLTVAPPRMSDWISSDERRVGLYSIQYTSSVGEVRHAHVVRPGGAAEGSGSLLLAPEDLARIFDRGHTHITTSADQSSRPIESFEPVRAAVLNGVPAGSGFNYSEVAGDTIGQVRANFLTGSGTSSISSGSDATGVTSMPGFVDGRQDVDPGALVDGSAVIGYEWHPTDTDRSLPSYDTTPAPWGGGERLQTVLPTRDHAESVSAWTTVLFQDQAGVDFDFTGLSFRAVRANPGEVTEASFGTAEGVTDVLPTRQLIGGGTGEVIAEFTPPGAAQYNGIAAGTITRTGTVGGLIPVAFHVNALTGGWSVTDGFSKSVMLSGTVRVVQDVVYRPPRYRLVYGDPVDAVAQTVYGIPALRQRQRGDGLGMSGAPRAIQNFTQQASLRNFSPQ